MPVGSLVVDAAPTGHNMEPKRYLDALLVVARSARRGEYALFHISSGSFFRADRLGALAMRALIDGRSSVEAIERVERIEAGSGARAWRLIGALDTLSALRPTPPTLNGRRWWSLWLAAVTMGKALTVLSPLIRVAPASFLAWLLGIWPPAPLARYVWRCRRPRIFQSLRASGYAGRTLPWLLEVSRPCAAEPSRNYLFNYLSVAVTPRRLEGIVNRSFDRDSADRLAACLQGAGPAVGAFLHGPLCAAVPNALRIRGSEVVRVVVPGTHGINVSISPGPVRDFFGESADMTVEETDSNASGALLRHLKAGRSVYVALDRVAAESKSATIEMLGQSFLRNDGPAWLAVRSGRPVALWTTHNSPSGVVISSSPLFYPDPSLPIELRVSALSEILYACAEAAIRTRPEAWTCWDALTLLQAPQP